MERSAINTYTAAGAFLGLLLGLYVSWTLIGLRDPGVLFTVAGLIATLPTAAAYLLVAYRYRHARRAEQVALAISGWFVLAASVVALIVATDTIFPKAVGG